MACFGAQISGGTVFTYSEKAVPFIPPCSTIVAKSSLALSGTWLGGNDFNQVTMSAVGLEPSATTLGGGLLAACALDDDAGALAAAREPRASPKETPAHGSAAGFAEPPPLPPPPFPRGGEPPCGEPEPWCSELPPPKPPPPPASPKWPWPPPSSPRPKELFAGAFAPKASSREPHPGVDARLGVGARSAPSASGRPYLWRSSLGFCNTSPKPPPHSPALAGWPRARLGVGAALGKAPS
mmetsp:Transcript_85877/g.277316  ORF Transcript_85877/g.277316 Transcript_85877/m.277316 type:complete len:239 (+) Transcript_85877:180-896(+)